MSSVATMIDTSISADDLEGLDYKHPRIVLGLIKTDPVNLKVMQLDIQGCRRIN